MTGQVWDCVGLDFVPHFRGTELLQSHVLIGQLSSAPFLFFFHDQAKVDHLEFGEQNWHSHLINDKYYPQLTSQSCTIQPF